ncbi:hypothetical protein [Umezawaea sp. Da 62-37]|uniref:hypothetical protein n=1 Tax=Umezawaea sp. Da 62-37 TaxID=3075927 RepID=UPI0028F6C476|nr:hypothetical protein [Umezawaea sp. Da 62-37]WNV87469.1 hypothetical protein RM788_03970 [Umezawaea sp. Da 62-37]
MHRSRTAAPEWGATEVELMVRAARRAPVHGTGHPWVLEPHGNVVSLYELPHHSLHDRLGFDRLLSCGAALHNVHTALQAFGWHVEVEFPRDVDRPDLLAVLTADDRQAPTAVEVGDYEAIEVPAAPGRIDLPALAVSNHWAGARLLPVEDDTSLAALGLPSGSAVLLVLTTGESRQDVLLAGAATQAVRLRARALGMTATPVHRPTRLPDGVSGHLWSALQVR